MVTYSSQVFMYLSGTRWLHHLCVWQNVKEGDHNCTCTCKGSRCPVEVSVKQNWLVPEAETLPLCTDVPCRVIPVCVYRKAEFVKTTGCLDMSMWIKKPWPTCESSDEKENRLYATEVADNPLCGEKGKQTPWGLHAWAEAVEGLPDIVANCVCWVCVWERSIQWDSQGCVGLCVHTHVRDEEHYMQAGLCWRELQKKDWRKMCVQ